jgi:hypothetical protein
MAQRTAFVHDHYQRLLFFGTERSHVYQFHTCERELVFVEELVRFGMGKNNTVYVFTLL